MEIATIQSNATMERWDHWDIVDSETGEKKWYHHMLQSVLPTRKKMNLVLTRFFVFVFFCMTLYGMLMKNSLPGSQAFALFFLAFLAALGGKVVEMIKLPPLLGMMIVGFLYRNLTFVPYYEDIGQKTIIVMREIALSIILMRAGLGIDGQKLKKLKLVVLRLTIVPLLVEASTMGVFAHYLLGLPWIFSFMLGFIMSAIAPEVVLPIILNLESKGYGVSKGIPTLLIAACSLDDIIAIAGFTVCFSVAFSTANLTWTIIKAPLEPIVGFAYGAVFGVIFWSFPSAKLKKNTLVFYNVLLLTLGAMTALFSSVRLGMPGSGPLGCITLAFVASIKFRKDENQFKGIQTVTSKMWKLIQPFLFALIGTEVTLETLRESAGYGTLSIMCGLICRSIATILACYGAGLNFRERLYLVFSWIPKAVVQAAIGSQALDYARVHNLHPELRDHGTTVLNISVLSILLTAPLSAILCTVFGPYLLTRDVIREEEDEYEEETSSKAREPPSEFEIPKTSEELLVPKDSSKP